MSDAIKCVVGFVIIAAVIVAISIAPVVGHVAFP
jgi:hypothetical protein